MTLTLVLRAAAAAPLWAATTLFRLLPKELASQTGAAIGRNIGALLPVNRTGDENLRRVFPEWSAEQRAAVLRDCWGNLGRLATEHSYPPDEEKLRVEGAEILESAKNSGAPVVFVSAHIGNWEALPIIAARYGLRYTGVYRQANNPFVERLIQRQRGQQAAAFIPKGKSGTKQLIRLVRSGEPVGMLVDQRLSEGIRVPFLGLDAATTTTPAELALRYGAQLIPAYARRDADGGITVVVEQPLSRDDVPEEQDGVLWLTTALNERISGWIRAYPAQWLWLHRRWR
ncbi:MAG: lysophospholipid acyltransferase family protein [Alphaproteobacteria bacterium]|nr:lysophospholipid acyltransferase family protein [Alphaproteobacteria bacterium]